jgi:hypothetical protein
VHRGIGPNALSRADLASYSQFENEYKNVMPLIESEPGGREAADERLLRAVANRVCTNSCHSPVDWLHSNENRAVASIDF